MHPPGRSGGPVLWRRLARCVLRKAEEKWKAREWRVAFGGKYDNEYVLRGVMWVDHYWLFSEGAHGHEPKPESLRWTSTCKYEDGATLKYGNRGHTWDLHFMEVYDVLDYRFHRDGKGTQWAETTLRNGMGSWWRDGNTYRSKSAPMKTKCHRVVSHVVPTALKGSVG